MTLVCLHCGKSFEGSNEKFCSNGCRDSHIASIEKRVKESTENDPSHTENLSRD